MEFLVIILGQETSIGTVQEPPEPPLLENNTQ